MEPSCVSVCLSVTVLFLRMLPASSMCVPPVMSKLSLLIYRCFGRISSDLIFGTGDGRHGTALSRLGENGGSVGKSVNGVNDVNGIDSRTRKVGWTAWPRRSGQSRTSLVMLRTPLTFYCVRVESSSGQESRGIQ